MDAMLLVGLAALAAMALGGKKKGEPNAPPPLPPVKVNVPPSAKETKAIVKQAVNSSPDSAPEDDGGEDDQPTPAVPGQSAPRPASPRPAPLNPRPTPSPKPVPAPAGGGKVMEVKTEQGVRVTRDDVQAKKSAQSTADHVRNKQYNYSRPVVAAWQALAGLKSDGIYGPDTANALRKYGAKNVAGPLFAGAKKK